MTTHTFRFFRFRFCLFFATISFLSPARISAYEPGVREALNAAAAPFFGFYFLFLRRPLTILDAKFDVAGTVTDVNGKKLDDVSMVLFFSRPKDSWGTESEGFSKTVDVDGDFHIEKRWYTSMQATFHKDGYYSESFMFYTQEKDGKGSPVQENFQVKLRKIGTLANLIRFEDRIKYDIKSNCQSVCDLSNLAEGKMNCEIVPLGDPVPLQKYICSDFVRDDQGEIIFGKKNGRGIHSPAPETYLLRLVSPDQKDGFILVEEPVKDCTYLTDAPQDGYNTKELVIPYENDRNYYFYIRCGKFYGKGVIQNLDARNGTYHYYGFCVDFFFNRKVGDTNLRSRMTY